MPGSPIDGREAFDEAAILALNNQHARETSPLAPASLAALLDMAFYAQGIQRGAAAFLIALDQDAAYASPNFLWFQQRGGNFVYVDRIIVASKARGKGLARQLYEDLFSAVRAAGQERVVCEVNLEPPNPASLAFHLAMGFSSVGEATLHEGKTVRYFEKSLR